MNSGQNNHSTAVELLAPGGSVDAVKAALLAGADAVYCGLPGFNARQRADNITAAQLPGLATIAHQCNGRIYLTLNTLVLEDEIDQVIACVADARAANVDAVIVQDFGLLYLLRNMFPDTEIHASTQMTTHNRGQVAFLAYCGVSQVNLSRELSLEEISGLGREAHRREITTEVFVYGAYCISFSGQCYMSCAMSGKSGNRGACVQPCRRMYRSDSSGPMIPPLNLRDNSAFAFASELMQAGVGSFKIEGRIKGYKYVFATVRAWRRQIDRVRSGDTSAEDDASLRTVFNRSLTAGYLDGSITREMFIGSSRDQSLQPVGKIRSFTADTGIIRLEREIEVDPETPVLVYGEGFTFVCTGFLTGRTGRFTWRLKITHKLKGKIQSGDMLYRQADFDGPSDLKQRIDALQVSKRSLRVYCSGKEGESLKVVWTTDGATVTVLSKSSLGVASSRPLGQELLTEKLGMLGDTPFVLEAIDCSGLDSGLFLPVRELNILRREAMVLLGGSAASASSEVTVPTISYPVKAYSEQAPSLAVLTNSQSDFGLSLAHGTTLLYEMPVTCKDYVRRFRSFFTEAPHIQPWFPAILIDSHFDDAAALLESVRFPRVVTDNSGIGWRAGRAGIPWVAGPLLNITNSFSLKAYQEYAGCIGAFISHELNRRQMMQVVAPEPCTRWYTLYAPLLLMNTRQCIVRNITGCRKEHADAQCLQTCTRDATLADDKNGKFSVVKREGFYNQLYNHRHYFNPAVVKDADNSGAVFFIDLRSIPGKTTVRCSHQELVSLCEAYIAGRVTATALRDVIADTTAAQYTRGI